jgi:glycosyltransferase involved in cell wall biosynthesis
LQSAGISVEVLPMPEASRALSRNAVRPRILPLVSLWHTARYIVAVRGRLRALSPDLVHTNSLKSALYGSVAARLAGVPVACHIRDRIADDYLPAAAVRLVRAALRVVPNVVIANSEATLATLGGRIRSGVVISSPVIYDAVTASAAARRQASGGPVRVGMVGRLAPWKGQHVFLEAFARAFPDGDDTAVLVGAALFGEDDYERELRGLVNRLGIGSRVEFAGFVDDVPAAMAAIDILVHASVVPEPFGLVVVEGMAMGLPVVAAAAGGPLEVVTNGVDGMLSPPGNVAALSETLALLAADPALRARLGSQARLRSAAFSPERVAAATLAVYDRLLGGPVRPRAGRSSIGTLTEPDLEKASSW